MKFLYRLFYTSGGYYAAMLFYKAYLLGNQPRAIWVFGIITVGNIILDVLMLYSNDSAQRLLDDMCDKYLKLEEYK